MPEETALPSVASQGPRLGGAGAEGRPRSYERADGSMQPLRHPSSQQADLEEKFPFKRKSSEQVIELRLPM